MVVPIINNMGIGLLVLAIAGVFILCRAGTYFFEIKKVCKKILPQGSGFLGNAKRKLNHVNFFNFRFGRFCCTKTLTRCAQTHEF